MQTVKEQTQAVDRLRGMPERQRHFLLEAAECLRDLASLAPDIAWQLRRFAEDIDEIVADVAGDDERF